MATNKRKVENTDSEEEQRPKSKRVEHLDLRGNSTPPAEKRTFSPLHTPSAVTKNDSFHNFSSENTLSMHTSVESSTRTISRIAMGSSMGSDKPPLLDQTQMASSDSDSSDLEPSPSRLFRKASRTRLSSFDLVDPLETQESPNNHNQNQNQNHEHYNNASNNNNHHHKQTNMKNEVHNESDKPFDLALGIAVSLAYASFIFCRSFFAVTQAAMKSDPIINLTDAQANTIITSFGVAFGIAKFPSGILVNSAPPKAALMIFMVLTSLAVALASHPWTDNYTKIMIIALLNAIPQAGAYPAVTKLVCAGFEPSSHSSVFAMISIGSRVGQVAVSLVLGEVLRRSGDWRVAIRVAPVVVMGAMLLVAVLTHGKKTSNDGTMKGKNIDTQTENETQTVVAPLSVRLNRLLKNPRFWLVNSSASMLLISKAFDTYAVRYITDICNYAHPKQCMMNHLSLLDETTTTGATAASSCVCKAYAAQITAGVSLGIVTSLLFGSWVYEKLKGNRKTRSRRAIFIISLCALNLLIASLLYYYTTSIFSQSADSYLNLIESNEESENRQIKTLTIIGSLLYLLGFASGYPFYVPQSLFAVEDASDAATVVGCGECVQSVLGAAVLLTAQHYAIGADGTTSWLTIWGAIVMAAGSGLVLMIAFMYASIKGTKHKTA